MNFKLPIRDKLLRFLGPTRMIARIRIQKSKTHSGLKK